MVALTERANEAIEKFSGGMKRRVNITASLVHRPHLLFSRMSRRSGWTRKAATASSRACSSSIRNAG